LITARDMGGDLGRDFALPAPAFVSPITLVAAPRAEPVATPFRERVLLVVLYITVFASSIGFIEPSPHDGLMGVLAVAGLIAGIRFHRILLVPFALLLVWNFAGMMALFQVAGQDKTIQYTATSIYLAIAAMLFAMLFAQNTMQRLSVMQKAYVLTAVIFGVLGCLGYFNAFPGADMFTRDGRAHGAFKDPNVFGPFQIWPILFLVERMLSRRIAVTDMIVAGIILFSLLLCFSRGAWFHFVVSALVMVALVILTAPGPKARMRVFGLSALCVAAMAGLLVLLLSFSSIGAMFTERAQLIQSYDVGGSMGRFHLQELALAAVLNFPNGMGPFEFARVHGLQQHNVYLQAFLVYGWAGAMAYLLLLGTTVWIGLTTALTRTPWQPYCITALAVFVGEIAEGFVIDTDHWRHFYLMLGIIWGLAAATRVAQRDGAQRQQALRFPAAPV
jgi:hypothetical protein